MYRSWKHDPSSVHASWAAYFSGLDAGLPSSEAFQPPPNLFDNPLAGVIAGGAPTLSVQPSGIGLSGQQELSDHLKVQLLVRAYQVRGHHIANLDPLGILDPDLSPYRPVELELAHYGFNERDLGKEFSLGPGILPHFAKNGVKSMTLKDIITTCRRVYCESPHSSILHNAYPSPPAQAVPSGINTSTSPTKNNATGSVNASRSPIHGPTPSTRSV
jgi:2-oxoglutarate dehydrogenase E1 component